MEANEPENPGTLEFSGNVVAFAYVDSAKKVVFSSTFVVDRDRATALLDWLQRAKAWLEYVPPKPFVPGWYWHKFGDPNWDEPRAWCAKYLREPPIWPDVIGPRIEQPAECGGPEECK